MPADVLTLFDLDHTLLPHDTEQPFVEFLVAERALDATGRGERRCPPVGDGAACRLADSDARLVR